MFQLNANSVNSSATKRTARPQDPIDFLRELTVMSLFRFGQNKVVPAGMQLCLSPTAFQLFRSLRVCSTSFVKHSVRSQMLSFRPKEFGWCEAEVKLRWPTQPGVLGGDLG